jgi:entry exclusion lipoprotein TrbK
LKSSHVITAAAAIAVGAFAYDSLTKRPVRPAPPTTAAECTPDAIRQVPDALERSILSAQCARRTQSSASAQAAPRAP